MNIKKLTRLSLLTALSLILFVVELQIPSPFPVPGIKLGLANIITVFLVFSYRPREAALSVAARVTLGSFFGGLSTLAYSAAGAAASRASILLIKRFVNDRHIWTVSVIGAVFHNMAQLFTAFFIMGAGILPYTPFLLLSGCLAGGFCGVCAQLVVLKFRHFD